MGCTHAHDIGPEISFLDQDLRLDAQESIKELAPLLLLFGHDRSFQSWPSAGGRHGVYHGRVHVDSVDFGSVVLCQLGGVWSGSPSGG
jgi:hypothetical protein